MLQHNHAVVPLLLLACPADHYAAKLGGFIPEDPLQALLSDQAYFFLTQDIHTAVGEYCSMLVCIPVRWSCQYLHSYMYEVWSPYCNASRLQRVCMD